jgi:hypothetical protein
MVWTHKRVCEDAALNQGGAMIANDSAHETNDVYFAGILIISLFSMIIGFLTGFFIAS